MTDDPFDDDFFNIQNFISQLNSTLVVINSEDKLKQDNILNNLALQIKLYGSKIIELYQTLDDYCPNQSQTATNDVSELQSKIQSMEKSLSYNINQIKFVQHEYGKKNTKVNWKEIFQTLEEGFDSAENLMSSCEVLQLLDYNIDAQSFLGIKEVQDYHDIISMNQVNQQIINWLAISNRIKDNSIYVLTKNFISAPPSNSFFEQVMKLEEILNENKSESSNVVLLKQKIEYLNSQLLSKEKNTKQLDEEGKNCKLQQDLEDLLSEFANLKQRYETVCEEFKDLNVEYDKQAKDHELAKQEYEKKLKKLNEEKEFAEGLEEIEHLKEIITEKDAEIEKLKLKKTSPSSSKKQEVVNQIFIQNLQMLRKLLNFTNDDSLNDNPSLEDLVSEVSILIDKLSANYNSFRTTLSEPGQHIQLKKLDEYFKSSLDEFLFELQSIYQIIDETNQQLNTTAFTSPQKYSRSQKLQLVGGLDLIIEKIKILEKSYPNSEKLQSYLINPRRIDPSVTMFNVQSIQRNLRDSIKSIKNEEVESQKVMEIKLANLQNQLSRQKIQIEESKDFVQSIGRRLSKLNNLIYNLISDQDSIKTSIIKFLNSFEEDIQKDEELEKWKKRINDERSQEQQKLIRIQSKLTSVESELNSVKEEKEKLKSKVEQLNENLKITVEKYQIEIQQLHKDNEKQTQQMNQVQKGREDILKQHRYEIELIKNEFEKVKMAIEDEVENEKKKQQNLKAQQEQTIQSLHIKWEKQLDRMKGECDKLQVRQ